MVDVLVSYPAGGLAAVVGTGAGDCVEVIKVYFLQILLCFSAKVTYFRCEGTTTIQMQINKGEQKERKLSKS